MNRSIGMDIRVFERDARKATRRALPFSASDASTIPKIFFWFGQINHHTLNNIMVPSQAPIPIVAKASLPSSALTPSVNAPWSVYRGEAYK